LIQGRTPPNWSPTLSIGVARDLTAACDAVEADEQRDAQPHSEAP
jgi:hypothetical protein